MKFPSLVYKCPGKHQRPGGTYDYVSVSNDEELKQRLCEGYHETLPQAMGITEPVVEGNTVKENDTKEDDDKKDDDGSPPTREELEAKAEELGIKIQKNMKDKTILNKIAKALAKD